jgi:hypothetical protein
VSARGAVRSAAVVEEQHLGVEARGGEQRTAPLAQHQQSGTRHRGLHFSGNPHATGVETRGRQG